MLSTFGGNLSGCQKDSWDKKFSASLDYRQLTTGPHVLACLSSLQLGGKHCDLTRSSAVAVTLTLRAVSLHTSIAQCF